MAGHGVLEGLPGRLVVCAPTTLPAFFVDDLQGACAICGAAVRFRPHTPAPRSLVCLLCFLIHAEPGALCELTAETALELAAVLPDVPKC